MHQRRLLDLGTGLSAILEVWSEKLHRELGAEIMQFRAGRLDRADGKTDVQVALEWYARAWSARKGKAISMEVGSATMSRADIEMSHATFARFAPCLTPQHPADACASPGDRWASLAAIAGGSLESRATEIVVSNMIGWVVGSAERGKQSMADRLEWSAYKLDQWANRVERVLWRRFVYAGLLAGGREADAVGAFLRWANE